MTWQSLFRERGSQHRFPTLKSQEAAVTSINSQEVEIGMVHLLGTRRSLSPLDTAQDSLPGEFPFQGRGQDSHFHELNQDSSPRVMPRVPFPRRIPGSVKLTRLTMASCIPDISPLFLSLSELWVHPCDLPVPVELRDTA